MGSGNSKDELDHDLISFSTDDQEFLKNKETELIEAYKNGKHDAVKRMFEEKASEWKKIPLNLAFVGQTGAGKSKLINVLRGLTAEDEGGAPVGVKQTTMIPICYPHPALSKFKLWDLPGVGTKEYPREKYLDLVGFENYDYFLIVTATRFMENDLWIAKEIQKHNKRFIFVRTKIFSDLGNIQDDYPTTYQVRQEAMLNEILVDIEKNLDGMYQRENVFLVDSKYKLKYEFSALQERLVETFPEEKRNALLRSLSATSKSMIQAKVESLKKDIKWAALASAAGGAIPIPGVSTAIDLGILVKYAKSYAKELGLDEDSCTNPRQAESLREIMGEGGIIGLLSNQGMISFLKTIPLALTVTANVTEEAAKTWLGIFIPLIGAIIGAVIGAAASFAQTTIVLRTILNKFEPTAVRVLEKEMLESVE